MKTAVLTGSPYSGKTTLIDAFEREGVRVVREAAIQVIDRLTSELGLEGQLRWKAARRSEFQARVARLQLELEAQLVADTAGSALLDRGILDGIAFCRAYGSPLPSELRPAPSWRRYDAVFLLDTLQPFAGRADTGRGEDYENAILIRDLLHAVYAEHGYEPVFVPQQPTDERMAFIRSRLP
jgi:predicted ATPase